MMIITQKRGQSHVEMIVSLVFFVGFLFFIFIFINPLTRAENGVVVHELYDRLLEEMSSEVGKLSIIVNSTNDCYDTQGFSDYGNSFIEVQDIDNPRRYTLYFGDFFDPSLTNVVSCSELTSRNFTIGPYLAQDLVVYSRVESVVSRYEQDYPTLRSELGGEGDFSFAFRSSDGTPLTFMQETKALAVTKEPRENAVVISRDINIQMIDERANFYESIVQVRIWE